MKKQPISVRTSESIVSFIGSWKGFFTHVITISSWVLYNTFSSNPFDPFPFIFLNLALSSEAAISACFILMSQNRAAYRDRKTLEDSYVGHLETRLSLAELADKLDKMEALIKRVGKNGQAEK